MDQKVNVDNVILEAQEQVSKIIRCSNARHRDVIARYHAVMAVNFTDWMGKTIPWVESSDALVVLKDNIQCEIEEDHIGMLDRFAQYSGAMPDKEDYFFVQECVVKIRNLLKDSTTRGLAGITLCAVLENTSLRFIPDIAVRAKTLGSNDLGYTDSHGKADIKHAKFMRDAMMYELMVGYKDDKKIVKDATDAAIFCIDTIYT